MSFFGFVFAFGFLASWRLGFSASWLLGFLASRLLGFSASCWFMRLLVAFWLWLFASSAFPVPLRQVAFWLLRLFAVLCGFGGVGFRILCLGGGGRQPPHDVRRSDDSHRGAIKSL